MTKRTILIIVLCIAAIVVVSILTKPTPIDPVPTAVQMLRKADIPVPPYAIKVTDAHPRNGSATAEGWVYEENPTIFIPSWSGTYQAAVYQDRDALMRLASILVHEGVHADGILDEQRAYDAQIAALIRLEAPYYLIDSVRLSERTVVHH